MTDDLTVDDLTVDDLTVDDLTVDDLTVDDLTVDDLLEVARRVVAERYQVRDAGLLASAVARPQSTVFGQDAYPGIWEKAAALMESLGRNHALVDGNKRLAWTATWLFLRLNGHLLAEPLDEDPAEQFVTDVVTGKLELPRSPAPQSR